MNRSATVNDPVASCHGDHYDGVASQTVSSRYVVLQDWLFSLSDNSIFGRYAWRSLTLGDGQ
jgi:hypothetical protein